MKPCVPRGRNRRAADFGTRAAYARRGKDGFTLLEAVVSVLIFGLLMLAVAALWMVAWRATERIAAGGESDSGAALVLHRLAEAVESSVFRPGAGGLYAWRGEDDGGGAREFDRMSFVTTQAPDSAEGNSATGPLERVMITSEAGPGGSRQLVLMAGPFTMDENDWQRRVVLLEDLGSIRLRYWSAERKDWVDGWQDENRAPLAVQISLARKGEAVDLTMDSWPLRAVARVRQPVNASVVVAATNAPVATSTGVVTNASAPNAK